MSLKNLWRFVYLFVHLFYYVFFSPRAMALGRVARSVYEDFRPEWPIRQEAVPAPVHREVACTVRSPLRVVSLPLDAPHPAQQTPYCGAVSHHTPAPLRFTHTHSYPQTIPSLIQPPVHKKQTF